MIKDINPEDFIYLWTDYDVDFIFTSCYLFENFRKSDIVLIYDHIKKGLSFYLSKRDKEKFSEVGKSLYKNDLGWIENLKNSIRKGNSIIKIAKKEEPPVLSDKKIKESISSLFNLFQELGNLYFYTEFFFIEKIENKPEYHEILSEVAKLKFKARKILNKLYNHKSIFKKYIDVISKRKNRNDVRWLSYNEIIDLLDGKKVQLSKRNSFDWILSKRNNWRLINEKELVSWIKKRFEKYFFANETNILKGICANKGRVIGKVKIINTFFSNRINKALEKINEGDIIIAETTGPEMITAMKKAKAIVTDEGGLISHAAIVSRELGKPCIVGTKNATKVFKDGDLVEVDADKGIVRKIK